MSRKVSELIFPESIDALSSKERVLLQGMLESEAMNGMALVPPQLYDDATALVDKLERMVPGKLPPKPE